MAKWRWQTDLRAGCFPLILYAVYLLYVFMKAPFYVGSLTYNDVGLPAVGANAYYHLQFIPCIIIVFMTTYIFGEGFRGSVRQYLVAFPIKTSDVILKRFFRLFVLLVLPHIPLVLLAVGKINRGIDSFIVQFPERTGFPYITVLPMLIHCVIALAFSIALGIFLLLIFRNRYLPVIITIVYCLLEAGPISRAFGEYALFYGSFTSAPLYTILPINSLMMLALTVVFLAITSASYRKVGRV